MSDAAPDPATDPATDRAPDPATDRATDRGYPVPVRGSAGDPEEVETPVFPHKPLLRLGYDRRAVDEFVTKVGLAVHNQRQTSVRADQVARMRFPSRRLGSGYRMREVDDYLGAAEALLRLREASRGVPPEPDQDQAGHRQHHPTRWIYAAAAVLVVVIVVFTVLQT